MPNGSELTLAHDAAKDVLKSQDTTLANVRTRANNVVSVAALLASFSAGIGLIKTDPSKGATLPVQATWALLAILVVIGVLAMIVFWPVKAWHFGPSPATINSMQKSGSTETAIRQHIIGAMLTGIGTNAKAIGLRQRCFRIAIALLVVETITLIIALNSIR